MKYGRCWTSWLLYNSNFIALTMWIVHRTSNKYVVFMRFLILRQLGKCDWEKHEIIEWSRHTNTYTHVAAEGEDTRAMRKLNWIQFNSFTSHFLLFIYSILYFCHCVGYNSYLQQLFDFVWYVSIVSFSSCRFSILLFPIFFCKMRALLFTERKKRILSQSI